MEVKVVTCSAYQRGQICKNGFPVGYPASSACTGNTCLCCGRYNDIKPACQNESINLRWLNEDGTPRNVDKGNNSFDNLEWEVNKFKDVGEEKL